MSGRLRNNTEGREGIERKNILFEVCSLPVGLARSVLCGHDGVRDDLAPLGRMAGSVRHVRDERETLAILEKGLKRVEERVSLRDEKKTERGEKCRERTSSLLGRHRVVKAHMMSLSS